MRNHIKKKITVLSYRRFMFLPSFSIALFDSLLSYITFVLVIAHTVKAANCIIYENIVTILFSNRRDFLW